MKYLTLITGGQRSGKSSFAQNLAEALSEEPVYLATARKWDEDFENRIKRHQADRGENWTTIEEEKEIGMLDLNGKTVVLDCITLWLTNIYHDHQYNVEASLQYAIEQWRLLKEQDATFIIVSNELGMGVHPEKEVARKFADLQGWMNQIIGKTANELYLMVAGVPMKIK
ncbi:MAG: bifunctional adenosylcobinamide kinase/adenosylcobinamide-phosphate guanylyltransferase [Chloroflexia bacterium]|nr:bifunctional adenosylcobinamide kinase/adenosylcobinamide-phosphate guanylyltransferase [Chloroflexia bacterium]